MFKFSFLSYLFSAYDGLTGELSPEELTNKFTKRLEAALDYIEGMYIVIHNCSILVKIF